MDLFFQVENPFLNEESMEKIRNQFAHNNAQSISIPEAYRILFCDRPDLGYDYELFLEDLQNVSLSTPHQMSFGEAMKFVQLMQ